MKSADSPQPKPATTPEPAVADAKLRRRRSEVFDVLDANHDGVLTEEDLLPNVLVHLVIGVKGNRLHLVLNTLHGLGKPIENIPYSFYKKFTKYKDEKGQMVEGEFFHLVTAAVPYCIGDSYHGFRVVGTTPDMCGGPIETIGRNGLVRPLEFAEGKNFRHEDFFGAVVGSVVAEESGLKIGDRIQLKHGTDEDGYVHAREFHVVGILKPASNAIDRSVFVNMEGFYLIEDHARPVERDDNEDPPKDAPEAPLDAGRDENKQLTPLPEEQREVTAILLLAKEDVIAIGIQNQINEGNIAQAAFPARVLSELLSGKNDLSLVHELGTALRLSGGKLSREQSSAGLRLAPIGDEK
ncbi:MAG: hypothetical protein IID44_13315 [Planctomycetes bacterium]|nr:hypothetical protein [Planctomycetota bacterium]